MKLVFGNGLVFLALGIASLVISFEHPLQCSTGYPPLQQWVFGTGVAYTIIGGCCSLFGLLIMLTIIGIIPVLIVIACSGLFTFAWMIVGSVSLWRDGGSCIDTNFTLWQMAMADVIISIVLVVCTGVSARHAE